MYPPPTPQTCIKSRVPKLESLISNSPVMGFIDNYHDITMANCSRTAVAGRPWESSAYGLEWNNTLCIIHRAMFQPQKHPTHQTIAETTLSFHHGNHKKLLKVDL